MTRTMRRTALAPLLVTAIAPTIWGTTYLTTTALLPPGRPLLAATLRALPAGVLLTAWGRRLPTGRWWWRSLLLGTLNIGGFFALLFVAAYRLPGGVAATAGAITPLLVVAVTGPLLLGERATGRGLAAAVLAVVGVGTLVLTPEAALDGVGVVAALGGAASMATGTALTKRWARPVPLLTYTGWQLLGGAAFLLPLTLLLEGAPTALTTVHVAGYAYLTVVGTAVAYSLWFRGLEHLAAGSAAFLGLLSPVVATALGYLVARQRLSAGQLLGAGIVLVSMVAAQRVRRPRAVMVEPPPPLPAVGSSPLHKGPAPVLR